MQKLQIFNKGLYSDYSTLLEVGFDKSKVFLDPGIGFGKDDSANLHLLQRSMKEASTFPLLVGLSRKSFIGRLLDIEKTIRIVIHHQKC